MPLLGEDLHYAYLEIEAVTGVDLPARKLVEIPIIDNVGERAQFEPLMRAFGLNPDIYPPTYWPPWEQKGFKPNKMLGTKVKAGGRSFPGSLIWRPFEGLPANADPDVFLYSPGWDFSGFIDNVIKLMHTMADAAIYVHCQLGADRTGAFHIGYLMRQYECSLAEATEVANTSTSAGPPNADYQRLVSAYSVSL